MHIRSRLRTTAVTAGVFALLVACSVKSADGPVPGSPATSPAATPVSATAAADKKGPWTVFVYLAADNDLEAAALGDLEQMTEAAGTQFIVLVDRSPEGDAKPVIGLPDFTDTRLLRIADGDVTVLDEPGEVNTGDPKVLSEFLRDGLTRYKSEHNALVIWDHGGGWKGAAWDDSSDKDHLDLDELSTATRDGLAGTGVERLDLVGFDACLMATYEVASSFAPYATYLVASEEVEPGTGWDWTTLATPGGATTRELGESMIDGYTVEAAKSGAKDSTLSLLDLTKLASIDRAVDGLSAGMKAGARANVGQIGSIRSGSAGYGKAADPAKDYHLVDLGDLARGFKNTPALAGAAGELEAAIASVVVMHKDGPLAAGSTGISAYFPPTRKLTSKGYAALDGASGWKDFVDAFHGGIESVAKKDLPTFTRTDRLLTAKDVEENAKQVVLHADVEPRTGGNISTARLYWGEVEVADPTKVTFFGERNAEVKGDKVSAAYDWKSLTISDGTAALPAYATLRIDDKGTTNRIVVPLDYHRGRSKAPGDLYLSMVDGKIVDATFYVRTGEGVAAIRPRPGDTFVPLLKHQDLSTMIGSWQPVAETGLSADAAKLRFRYAAGTEIKAIMLGIGILDVAGNVDYVYYGTAAVPE